MRAATRNRSGSPVYADEITNINADKSLLLSVRRPDLALRGHLGHIYILIPFGPEVVTDSQKTAAGCTRRWILKAIMAPLVSLM